MSWHGPPHNEARHLLGIYSAVMFAYQNLYSVTCSVNKKEEEFIFFEIFGFLRPVCTPQALFVFVINALL